MKISFVQSIEEVSRDEWDDLVGPDGSPFLEWDWLASLEQSGCATAATGWVPHHVTVREGVNLVAAVPLYLKYHSEGEFVFDHGWARAAQRAGIAYYPKLLAAVPFTPASGRRLLTHPEADRHAILPTLADGLREICVRSDVSSVHVNFCADDELEPLAAAGFRQRNGMQYHWFNRGYASFEDYLLDLKSKRRNQIRRERRELAESGLDFAVLEGEAIPDALFEPMFRIYRSTVEKMYWGHPYLNRTLFELLCARWKRNLCVILARKKGAIVAGTINVQKAGVFYGRYWGTFEEIRNLHFEVCYYRGIEHCIARGHYRFEPGAGGEFKYLRGFEPVPTYSMHFVADVRLARAVADFLDCERDYVDGMIGALRDRARPRRSGPA